VLLLDEPFGALDVKIRAQLRKDLRAVQQRLGVTAILVTHDQDEAFELADRIGVIERGRLLEIGTSNDLYRAPTHRYTASFLGTANVLRGRRQNDQLTVGDAHWSLPGGDAVLVRPEGLILAPSADLLRQRAAHTLGSGTIAEIAFAVPLPRVMIDWVDSSGSNQRLIALAESDKLSNDGLHVGTQVWIGFDHGHLLPNSAD
jgi:ABC-type sulfate/molybdate transport systems ATPase subunit